MTTKNIIARTVIEVPTYWGSYNYNRTVQQKSWSTDHSASLSTRDLQKKNCICGVPTQHIDYYPSIHFAPVCATQYQINGFKRALNLSGMIEPRTYIIKLQKKTPAKHLSNFFYIFLS